MKPLKIAVEYERGLHHAQDFTVADVAIPFLYHPLNMSKDVKTKYFHEEGTLHQTEFNSLPASSLAELCLDFLKAEELRDKICAELVDENTPISGTGAGLATINARNLHRIYGYETIFGEKATERLIRISGIHLHIDQNLERLTDQFNALTALLPTIAFTSTSPISHEGKNSMNCHRYHTIADPKEGVFVIPATKDIPKWSENRSYIASIKELEKRNKERYSRWNDEFSNTYNRHKNKNLPLDYNPKSFMLHFTEETTGYPDVRFRPDMGQGTFELRINDSAPLDIVLAQAGLVLGYMNQIMLGDIPVTVAENNHKNDNYQFNKKSVILPNRCMLDHYTDLAMNYGLENPQVRDYLSALCDFAKKGLSDEEQPYLKPYFEMLSTGENVATQLLKSLGHKIIYSPQDGALANRFVWEKHQQAVQTLQEKTGYQRGSLLCAE